ncbi:MAG: recombination protein RecR [Spirochaetaceae bacterium]|nr:MAG: recombination protein RecR [Spirochaetaceae bacterium]
MNSLTQLIDEFAKLPGLGKKSASRIVYHLLKMDETRAQALGRAIIDLKKNLHECLICGNYSNHDPCVLCEDPGRDKTLLCVVEEAKDILTIEATNEYRGLYHVLGGVLSPLNGIGPGELRLRELIARLKAPVSELIIATNPTVEGDTTALYISKTVSHLGIPVSRLALGLPVGGDIEYADRLTIGRALKGRTRI